MSAADTSLSQAPAPDMPDVAQVLGRFDRGHLEAFVTVAIDLLDVLDGDPDQEIEDPAGETMPVREDPELDDLTEDDSDPDLEETDTEDAFALSRNALSSAHGAGCPISDPGGGAADDEGEPDEDAQGDQSWVEWHTMRGSQKRCPNILAGHEDDEDDDPAEEDDDPGQNSEDEMSSDANSLPRLELHRNRPGETPAPRHVRTWHPRPAS